MESRADRRRRERGERKPETDATRRKLRIAQEELDSGAISMEASHATTFAIMVTTWHMVERQREGARLSYNNAKELSLRGREIPTQPIVKQYAEGQEELLILEDQMRAFLTEVAEDDRDEAEELVAMRHPVPGTSMSYRLPEQAVDRVWGIEDPGDDIPPTDPGDNKA